MLPEADPFLIELIVVKDSCDGVHRSALSRDVERGRLLRLRRGVYVDRAAYGAMTPEQQHVVRMRALVAAADRPVMLSHFSAAVVHGLPVLRFRLDRVHTTVDDRRGRGQEGVTGHVHAVKQDEVQPWGDLLVTTVARTVVDVAAAASFEEGVMAADAALHSGLPRQLLLDAVDLAGPRRAGRRLPEVVRFAHPGAESAAESRTRSTLMRLGIEPPELQHRLVLGDGSEVFLDLFFRSFRVGAEVDGAVKLLDPAISRDARVALLREKRREDAVRLQLRGFARWGWQESGSTERLAAVLRQVGVHPPRVRATSADYAAAARTARPRAHAWMRR